MSAWKRKSLRLRKDHSWTGTPGHKVFVADRGAVRFDFPESWVVIPDPESIKFYNRPQPDDDCRLQFSIVHAPPGVDVSQLPIAQMLEETSRAGEDPDTLGRSAVFHEQRAGLQLAWVETRFIDPGEKREARSRTCVAKGKAPGIIPVITLDYWPEDAKRFLPVWDTVLRTLRLGDYIADPTRGPAPQ